MKKFSQKIPVFALFYHMKLINPEGERYTTCTEVDSHGQEWCSTLTDVLDNHLTGYWGNCDYEQNELAQVTFMSLIYKTTQFDLLLRIAMPFIFWNIIPIRILEEFFYHLLLLARKFYV